MHKLESQTRFLKMQFPRTSDAHEYAQSTSRGTFRVSCALRCDTYTAAGSGHWAEREREGSEGVAVEGVVLVYQVCTDYRYRVRHRGRYSRGVYPS